jgi:hypothetical protein
MQIWVRVLCKCSYRRTILAASVDEDESVSDARCDCGVLVAKFKRQQLVEEPWPVRSSVILAVLQSVTSTEGTADFKLPLDAFSAMAVVGRLGCASSFVDHELVAGSGCFVVSGPSWSRHVELRRTQYQSCCGTLPLGCLLCV